MQKRFHSIIILRFGQAKVVKEEFCGAKRPIKTRNVNINNISISKLVETKNNAKYLVGYLDEVKKLLL